VGIVALVGMAWSASTMFRALRRGLNIAFGVPEQRSAVAGKAWDLASVAGLLVLIPIGIIVTALLLFLLLLIAGAGLYLTRLVLSDQMEQQIPSAAIGRGIAQFGSYANSFVLVLLLYRFGPDRRLPMRMILPAAALAALGVEALKFGFSIYLSRFARFEAIYGALSTAAGFLLFVYILSCIILFVAVLTSVLHEKGMKDEG
jgi:membrane protein